MITKHGPLQGDLGSLHHYLTYPSVFRNRNFWVLFGTCSWFLLDISFYSQNLFLPNVLTDIGYSPKITLPYAAYAKAKQPVIIPAAANVTIGVSVSVHSASAVCSAAEADKLQAVAFPSTSRHPWLVGDLLLPDVPLAL